MAPLGIFSHYLVLSEIRLSDKQFSPEIMRRPKLTLSWFAKDMTQDIRARLPYYISDWTDAIDYRVVPATIYIYFANILPAIAFAQDMFDRTNNAYGLNEVLMASAMGGIVFGLFAGQPLCIVGVTGPITIFNYTVFEIMQPRGTNYFAFMAWIHIWSFIMHTIIAVCNGVRFMKYVTLFSCDIFGCFINIIYIQKGVEILLRQFEKDPNNASSAYFSIVVALCILIFGVLFVVIGRHSPLLLPWMRTFLLDYSLPLVVVFFTGFTFFPGRISDLDLLRLNRSAAFMPTSTDYDRKWGWFIHFWDISVGDVFLAIPFAILLTALFYFDHNISSIMCQPATYHFTKPASFTWDFFLLGITTLVAGLLGIPAPNGLIPQAPLHTACLKKPGKDGRTEVVEQRFTNFVQGLMTIGTMTGPLLIVLHLVPQGVLSGLFFMMGVPGLLHNEVTRRVGLLLTDPKLRDPGEPLYQIPQKFFLLYMGFSLAGVAGEVAITETIAAVGFPGVLWAFMIIGMLLRRIFKQEHLEVLDGPAASAFIMSALDPSLKKSLENKESDPNSVGKSENTSDV